MQQHVSRNLNHPHSEKSKSRQSGSRPACGVCVGDLVYLFSDKSKLKARNRYLVVSCDGEWCFIKKFSGNQLHASSYKVKQSECYRVPSEISSTPAYSDTSVSDEECDQYNPPPEPAVIPDTLTVPSVDHEVSNEVPILIGEPAFTPPVTQDNCTPHEHDICVQPIDPPSRPQCTRKLPTYLSDYVL